MKNEENLPKFLDLADEFEMKYEKVSELVEFLSQKELRRCLKAALAGKLYPRWVNISHQSEAEVVDGMIELEEIRIKMLIEHMIIEGEIQKAEDSKVEEPDVSDSEVEGLDV